MFEQELYPTPVPVIEKMLARYCREFSDESFDYDHPGRVKYSRKYLKFTGLILDPESGSGAILDYLSKTLKIESRHLVAIELDLELRFLLQGKGYKVIGSDFLEYDEPCEFGLIVANPPFSNGVNHALKIWEVLAPKGEAAILLNRETIDNPLTKDRRVLLSILASQIDLTTPTDFIDRGFSSEKDLPNLLKRLESAGRIEYLGQCFQDSERPTDVEVVLIRLTKPAKPTGIQFDDLKIESDGSITDEEFAANPLARRDFIRDLVDRYNAAVAILKERGIAQSKLDLYLSDIEPAVYDACDRKDSESLHIKPSLSDQVAALKSRFWNTLFRRSKLGQRATSHFFKKFDSYARQQSSLAFTVANINELVGLFFHTQEETMKECLEDVFDRLSAYCEGNKVYREGWKTNKSWRLNKKIIHPYGIRYEKDWGNFSMAHHSTEIYEDLDKVLCYVGGISPEKGATTYRAIDNFVGLVRRGTPHNREFESCFFKIRIFKKGTVHLVFKDLKLLEDFNRKVAEGKNWLGDGS